MNTYDINMALGKGDVNSAGILPKLEELVEQPFVLHTSFGLESLPELPGVILIRGARQYGKSTWLQQQIKDTILNYGHGTAFYLNGDELRNENAMIERIRSLVGMYDKNAPVRRLFVDEITAIDNWQRGLKLLLDAGELRKILVVTTGSKAADIRHGTERLPGRKGKLDRSSYIFTPISYSEFKRVCKRRIKSAHILPAYLISGGSPCACISLAVNGHLPEYVIEMVRDWIYGEFAASKRSRPMLNGVMECITRFAGSSVGQTKLAREAGLSNNTVAAGYIDLLADLMCVSSAFAWDSSRERLNRRRPCKFHMTNLLVAVAWHSARIRSPEDFISLSSEEQGGWLEWLVAQELWRRSAIRGDEFPELLSFWQGGRNEIDFVVDSQSFIEVKRGKTSPMEFEWFPRTFPKGYLTVISKSRFETDQIKGVTLADFLEDGGD